MRTGPNGLRTAGTPHALAARNKGRNTRGNMWVCLWVSRWETTIPAACSLRICAVASASISSGLIRPSASAQGETTADCRKAAIVGLFVRQSGDCRSASRTGEPSTSTTWQPTLSRAQIAHVESRRRRPAPLAISVAEVTMPCAMRLDDGAIHSLSETEIIRIDDQTPHATV